jgi:hypothetical protein
MVGDEYVSETDAMTKLTLSAEKTVIRAAKRLARQRKSSVSALFARFVTAATMREWTDNPIGPLARKASGIVSLPPGRQYRDLLDEALLERHKPAQ